MKEGFYKLVGEELLYGPNFIYSKDYSLLREEHTTYSYPVDGWSWFDSLEEACLSYNLDVNKYKQENELT